MPNKTNDVFSTKVAPASSNFFMINGRPQLKTISEKPYSSTFLTKQKDETSINLSHKQVTDDLKSEIENLACLEKNKDFKKLHKCAKTALNKRPDNVTLLAFNGLALLNLRKLDAAKENITKAIKLNNKSSDLWIALAAIQYENGDLKSALEASVKASKLAPDSYNAIFNAGKIYSQIHNYEMAIKSFEKSIELDPNNLEARIFLAQMHHFNGNLDKALEIYVLATQSHPEHPSAYIGVSNCLHNVKFNKPIPHLRVILERIVENSWYGMASQIAPATVSIIKHDRAISEAICSLSDPNSVFTIDEIVSRLSSNNLLINLMAIVNIADIDLENLFRFTRAALLFGATEIEKSPATLRFQQSLALQCFGNEFLYPESEEETLVINALETKILEDIGRSAEVDDFDIAILAAYRPLINYDWSEALGPLESLSKLLKIQIHDRLIEKKLQLGIGCLGIARDKTSLEVQKQYEQNPYPRWTTYQLQKQPQSIEDFAITSNLRIDAGIIGESKPIKSLIAGCGTGQQIITNFSSFNSTEIIGVDLSTASLAYAQRKVDELDITNVKLYQADILELDKLEQSFEIVECSGVLHHMADPISGWQKLTSFLKPGGLMKIGLYSKTARSDIAKMREEINELGMGTSVEEMKIFRNHVIHSADPHYARIRESSDFFSLSNFRDLLFNVHETYFTIPEIQIHLSDLGLTFCGMSNWRSLIRPESNLPAGEANLFDLGWWNEFEKANPYAFFAMYQFWCQKGSD